MNFFKNIIWVIGLFVSITALPMKRPSDSTDQPKAKRQQVCQFNDSEIDLTSPDDTTQHIKLTTSDNKIITINLSIANKCETLKDLIEEFDNIEQHNIPLHNITSSTFKTIVKLLQKPETISDTIVQLEIEELFHLINAVNFLTIEALFNPLLKEWAHICILTLDVFKNNTNQHVAYNNNKHILPDDLNILIARLINTKYGISSWVAKNLNFCKQRLRGDADSIRTLCYSPDGTTFTAVFPSSNRAIEFWQQGPDNAWFSTYTLQHSPYSVSALCYSPDGATLAYSLSSSRRIKLWQKNSNNTWTCTYTLESNLNSISNLYYSPDGTTLAAKTWNGAIELWQQDPNNTWTCTYPFEDDTMYIHALCYSPDGTTLASGSSDGIIKLWQKGPNHTLICINTLEGHTAHISALCYSHDGTILASGSSDGIIKLWQKGPNDTWICIDTLEDHTMGISALCYSPDGTILVSSSYDKTIKFWKKGFYGTLVCTTSLEDHVNFTPAIYYDTDIDGDDNWIQSLCYSPDGTTVTSGTYGGIIEFWNVMLIKETLRQINSLSLEQMLLLLLIKQSQDHQEMLDITHNQNLIDIFNSLSDDFRYVLKPFITLDLPRSAETATPLFQSSLFDWCLIQ